MKRAVLALLLMVAGAAVVAQALTPALGADPVVTNADIEKWMTTLSNWGRWGKDDQRGTLNLITADKRKQALRLAREGVPVSLAHTLDKEQFPDNPRPLGQQMTPVPVPGGTGFPLNPIATF